MDALSPPTSGHKGKLLDSLIPGAAMYVKGMPLQTIRGNQMRYLRSTFIFSLWHDDALLLAITLHFPMKLAAGLPGTPQLGLFGRAGSAAESALSKRRALKQFLFSTRYPPVKEV